MIRNIDVPDRHVPVSNGDRAIMELYEAAVFHGMPVSVQLITRRLQDEKALAYAELLDQSLNNV